MFVTYKYSKVCAMTVIRGFIFGAKSYTKAVCDHECEKSLRFFVIGRIWPFLKKKKNRHMVDDLAL